MKNKLMPEAKPMDPYIILHYIISLYYITLYYIIILYYIIGGQEGLKTYKKSS